jgi:uncharacterized membrane protein YvlD (DUF360 family)
MGIIPLINKIYIKGGTLMSHNNEVRKEGSSNNSILRWIGRLILVAIILGITSFVTPGFSIHGLWSYLIAAVVITALDYLVEAFMGVDASPFGKGIKGFIIAAVIIYLAQFLVPTMRVSIIGAILAALVIGILDAVFPTRAM